MRIFGNRIKCTISLNLILESQVYIFQYVMILDFSGRAEKIQPFLQLFREYRLKKVMFLEEKIMKSTARKIRSNKLRFKCRPIVQYFKKVKGKTFFFGCDMKEVL